MMVATTSLKHCGKRVSFGAAIESSSSPVTVRLDGLEEE